MNTFLGCLLLYEGSHNASPKLLWKYETGDRGNGGLRGAHLHRDSLVVDEYASEVNPVQSLCCPKKYRRSYYAWRAGKFTLTKSEVFNNEYSNAYFVAFDD